jgi:hypothetical protein
MQYTANPHKSISRVLLPALLSIALFDAPRLTAEAVSVRQPEGVTQSSLALRTLEGETIADGELTQTVNGPRVSSRLVFRFKDGSLHDETTVFTQSGRFRLVSNHLVQKGPAFKRPLEMWIDSAGGMVTVRYSNEKGEERIETRQMDLPVDLANGMVPILLKNLPPGTRSLTSSVIMPAPKPMLVKLDIVSGGQDALPTGGKATRYVVRTEIPGLRGKMANLVGGEAAESCIWIFNGPSPAFLKSEGPGFEGGPIWRTEVISPVSPKGETAGTAKRNK